MIISTRGFFRGVRLRIRRLTDSQTARVDRSSWQLAEVADKLEVSIYSAWTHSNSPGNVDQLIAFC